ncbi:uncharacterized protein HMF8227_00542 [Saliniradius amylolyticus]|uniref:Cell wall-active antibiotics response LiaF-like C-terminal domain-containing protein n=1 Tax=Saliniradius amylolyticus TaxID=2183582 RepID=A0A2S2E067_9ALTE|nr:LiaF domain-containing protein [Saliniradius amylolyticus]AWL11038.1 uncharacterized protein HMF8227_00542 [Saliniradius amylolyticus]
MDVKLEDRPIEQVREEVIDQLIYNYSHGVISAEAFERRLDDAINSEQHQSLKSLVADLELRADSHYVQRKETQFTPNYATDRHQQKNQRLLSILGSDERSGQWRVPKEVKLVSILGSIKLDFTDAVFEHQHVTVNINCVLGSETIYVPESVNVVCSMFNVIGSVENKVPSMAGRQAPTIYIEGYSVLGSVEIKVKRTMKEKFVSFANSLKQAFYDDGSGGYKA